METLASLTKANISILLIWVCMLQASHYILQAYLKKTHTSNVFCAEAVNKVAERLLGPFNIEMLVRPINLKISEAIMNFQESSQDVSQRVFSGCGRPILGRRRRRRNNKELELESLHLEQDSLTDEQTSSSLTMDKLVKEIKQKVTDTRQFWGYLPYIMCNINVSETPSGTNRCWNGTHFDKWGSTKMCPARFSTFY